MADNFNRTAIPGPLLITGSASTSTILETMTRSGIPATADADANPYTTSGQTRTALIVGTDATTSFGGTKLALHWLQQNIATNQSSVAMKIADVAGVTHFVVPFAGSIVGIGACANANITASTIRFIPTINGATVTGMGAQNAATTVRTITKTQAKDTTGSILAVGDRVGVKVTSNAAYAPTTLDWTCTLWLEA